MNMLISVDVLNMISDYLILNNLEKKINIMNEYNIKI